MMRRPAVIAPGSEPSLADEEHVAGVDLCRDRYLVGARTFYIAPGDQHIALVAARTVTAGKRDGVLDRHVGLIGIAAGGVHFAQDEERTRRCDLDRNAGIAQIT